MLDHDPRAVLRAFTLSAILRQNGLEYDVLPANFGVGLERFKAIPKRSIKYTIKDMLKADPDQIAEDGAAIEEDDRRQERRAVQGRRSRHPRQNRECKVVL